MNFFYKLIEKYKMSKIKNKVYLEGVCKHIEKSYEEKRDRNEFVEWVDNIFESIRKNYQPKKHKEFNDNRIIKKFIGEAYPIRNLWDARPSFFDEIKLQWDDSKNYDAVFFNNAEEGYIEVARPHDGHIKDFECQHMDKFGSTPWGGYNVEDFKKNLKNEESEPLENNCVSHEDSLRRITKKIVATVKKKKEKNYPQNTYLIVFIPEPDSILFFVRDLYDWESLLAEIKIKIRNIQYNFKDIFVFAKNNHEIKIRSLVFDGPYLVEAVKEFGKVSTRESLNKICSIVNDKNRENEIRDIESMNTQKYVFSILVFIGDDIFKQELLNQEDINLCYKIIYKLSNLISSDDRYDDTTKTLSLAKNSIDRFGNELRGTLFREAFSLTIKSASMSSKFGKEPSFFWEKLKFLINDSLKRGDENNDDEVSLRCLIGYHYRIIGSWDKNWVYENLNVIAPQNKESRWKAFVEGFISTPHGHEHEPRIFKKLKEIGLLSKFRKIDSKNTVFLKRLSQIEKLFLNK